MGRRFLAKLDNLALGPSCQNLPFRKSLAIAVESDQYKLQNEILLPLPPNEIKLLLSKPTAVFLKHQLLIQEAGEQIKYCYFPNTSMISILTVMGDGKSIEVGLAGRESFVGAPLAVGFRTSAQRGVVQSEGTAYRIGAELFLEVLERCPQLNRLLIRNEYRRGKVHVLDRKRLERASCECYQIMKNQLETWDGETFRNRECN